MPHIFQQKFYRIGTSVRGKPKQEITVQVEIADPAMHPQRRRLLAKRALEAMEEARFKSGWTPWMFGRSTVITNEYVEVVKEPETFGVPDPKTLSVPDPETLSRNAAIERLKPYQRFKIKNVYEDEDFPVDAVMVLQPDFEYPDWDNERVSKLWKKC